MPTDLTRVVDAAARAWFDRSQADRRDDGRLNPATGKPWRWEDLRPIDQHAVRQLVLPVVQAVLAVVEEEVADDGVERCPGCGERLNVIEVRQLCDPRFVEVRPCTACGEGGSGA